eukprot:2245688-Rhodomonas_salina.2
MYARKVLRLPGCFLHVGDKAGLRLLALSGLGGYRGLPFFASASPLRTTDAAAPVLSHGVILYWENRWGEC